MIMTMTVSKILPNDGDDVSSSGVVDEAPYGRWQGIIPKPAILSASVTYQPLLHKHNGPYGYIALFYLTLRMLNHIHIPQPILGINNLNKITTTFGRDIQDLVVD